MRHVCLSPGSLRPNACGDRPSPGTRYRLLEDFIITDDTILQARMIQLFADYPELPEAAPATFSRGSLQESRKTYGDTAADLEQHRLNLYEKVAKPEDYSLALENFRNIFQVSPDTRETASH